MGKEERKTVRYWGDDQTEVGLFFEDGEWKRYEKDYMAVRWYGPFELEPRDKQELGLDNTKDSLED